VHVAQRDIDPGDLAILAEARTEGRVLLTKDNDIGTLVFRDGERHSGILLIDDLGSAAAECALLIDLMARWLSELAGGAFIRAGRWGSRLVSPSP
jgi:predicted nuclease of predicted toxin-antitoxin system